MADNNDTGDKIIKTVNIPNSDGSITRTLVRENGIKAVLRIVGDNREGHAESFYADGTKETDAYFKDDKVNGLYHEWNEDSSIKRKLYVLDGDGYNPDELRPILASVLGIEESALDVTPLFQPPLPLEQYKAEMFEPIKVRDSLKQVSQANDLK